MAAEFLNTKSTLIGGLVSLSPRDSERAKERVLASPLNIEVTCPKAGFEADKGDSGNGTVPNVDPSDLPTARLGALDRTKASAGICIR